MQDNISPIKVFTIMPSGLHDEYLGGPEESDHIYSTIVEVGIEIARESIKRNIDCKREVDKLLPGSVTKRIIQHLWEADIVIADLTGKNANVFLELGFRYAFCDKGTILLRQREEEIPFDIANYKAITYNKYKTKQAAHALADALQQAVNSSTSDSPVYDSLNDLEVFRSGRKRFGQSDSSSQLVMSWPEIMTRINNLQFYQEPHAGGRFLPDAIVGITNGGLIMAEIISRKFFPKVPLIALWADRWSRAGLDDPSAQYFTNDYSRSAIAPLKKMKEARNHPITVMVIDDNVASGTTCKYAVRFLREELGLDTKIIFQPLVVKTPQYLSAVEEMLAPDFDNGLFGIDKDSFIEGLKTNKSKFPYDKEIRSGA